MSLFLMGSEEVHSRLSFRRLEEDVLGPVREKTDNLFELYVGLAPGVNRVHRAIEFRQPARKSWRKRSGNAKVKT